MTASANRASETEASPRGQAFLLPSLTALLGFLLLPVSLFLDWYEYAVTGSGGTQEALVRLTGWRAFETLDAALVLLAFGGIALVLAEHRLPSQSREWALLAFGGVAVLLVALQLVNEPPILELLHSPTVSPRAGAWLALAGAVLVLIGGILHFFGTAQVSATGGGRSGSPQARGTSNR